MRDATIMAAAAALAFPTLALAAGEGQSAPPAADAGKAATYTVIQKEAKTQVFKFDYGPPTSPAVKLSGLTSGDLTASTSLKPFVLSIPSLLSGDAQGQAVAFDFNPHAALAPHYTWNEYRALSAAEHAWWRLRVNLIGYRGVVDTDASKDKASQLGFGLSTRLLDESDPMLTGDRGGTTYWQRCVDRAIDAYIPKSFEAKSRQQALADNQHAQTEVLALLRYLDDPTTRAARMKEPAIAAAIDRAVGSHLVANGIVSEAIATQRDGRRAEQPNEITDPSQLVAVLKAAAATAQGDDRTKLLAAAALVQQVKTPAASQQATASSAEIAAPESSGRPTPDAILDELKQKENALKTAEPELIAAAHQEAVKEAADAGYTGAVSTCAQRAATEAGAHTTIDVGAGMLWHGEPGEFKHFDNGDGAVWIGAKWPFKIFRDESDALAPDDSDRLPTRVWALGGSARYAWREGIQTGDKATPIVSANTMDIWGGLETSTDTNRFAVEIGHYQSDPRDKMFDRFDKTQTRWLVNASLRLSDAKTGMWGNITYGNASGATSALKDETLLFTLSFGPVDGPELFDNQE